MKPNPLTVLSVVLLLAWVFPMGAAGQSAPFTYQGVLTDNGVPVTGLFDVEARLFGVAVDGLELGAPIEIPGVPVTNGLVTLALDFGPGQFTGDSRWLELSVRPTLAGGPYVKLVPRQRISPAPQAIHAGTAGQLLGPLPASQLQGPLPSALLAGTFPGLLVFNNVDNVFAGNGEGLVRLNAGNITGGLLDDARLSPNIARLNASQSFAGTNVFHERVGIGTNLPVSELHVRGTVTANAFAGSGAGLSNLPASSLVGTLASSQIAPGSITPALLAPGAAASNLHSAGLSGVPSGGLLLSANSQDANLQAAGYVRLGSASLGESWENLPAAGAPAPRYAHVAVWTGHDLIVWGGSGDGGTYFADGARFHPATRTWSPMSAVGAPAARRLPSATWTGTELLVWGGGTQGGTTNDGGIYNATTDSWRPISTIGAPSPRSGAAAIWIGNELLVWGGLASGQATNDGARYNPVTDSWTPMSSSLAPAARYFHAAVWTGSELIVWGGYNGTSYLADGRRYNPLTDSWTPCSTIGAPAGRWMPSAIWTGSHMLVWGGSGNSGFLNSGGVYNAAANTWDVAGIPTNGAPVGRRDHAAIWTGREMLVWGGSAGANLNDGGRYDPASKVWTPLSLSGTPVPRLAVSANWTGAEMVIFGGTVSGVNSDELRSYAPPRAMFLYQRP